MEPPRTFDHPGRITIGAWLGRGLAERTVLQPAWRDVPFTDFDPALYWTPELRDIEGAIPPREREALLEGGPDGLYLPTPLAWTNNPNRANRKSKVTLRDVDEVEAERLLDRHAYPSHGRAVQYSLAVTVFPFATPFAYWTARRTSLVVQSRWRFWMYLGDPGVPLLPQAPGIELGPGEEWVSPAPWMLHRAVAQFPGPRGSIIVTTTEAD